MQPMSVEEVAAVLDDLSIKIAAQTRRADNIDSWIRPELTAGFDLPDKASREHRALARLSRTPWLGLVVTNVAQAMYVDHVVGSDGPVDELWRLWNSNRMGAHQIAAHRAFIAYGESFGVVTPATLLGVESARMRCLSPRRMAVEWEDAATDPHPVVAAELMSRPHSTAQRRWRVYDAHHIYSAVEGVDAFSGPERWHVTGIDFHGVGVTPVVRFANLLDLDGRVSGEADPFIPAAARINKTSYDRLLAQHFNSWKVRTIAGIDLPEETGDPATDRQALDEQKVRLSQEDILMSEAPDTKFGTLDATALDPFVNSWRSDIEALAAVSQTPAHALTGQLVNLSAEALAAARAPLTQKVWERQVSAGEAWAGMLRLAASIAGHDAAAVDPLIRVTWQDMEIRSMSQAVDALGKAAQMLGIPARALWHRIPGVERSDTQEWEKLVAEDRVDDPLDAMLRRHTATTASPAGDDAGE
ncbi:phage portal protein [Corynebacterium sphenisci]|uniref:phage portal protein n=1 Tax=Corynebacterium sphenisci TaxID=191493 RepID=UPI000951498F|nr:phage portal protein [Corynebacterium sphenisci]